MVAVIIRHSAGRHIGSSVILGNIFRLAAPEAGPGVADTRRGGFSWVVLVIFGIGIARAAYALRHHEVFGVLRGVRRVEIVPVYETAGAVIALEGP